MRLRCVNLKLGNLSCSLKRLRASVKMSNCGRKYSPEYRHMTCIGKTKWSIGNPSSRENLVMTSPYERPSSVQTLGEGQGRLNVKLCRTLLKTVNIPIKYFVSHFLLPSPNRKVFRKHANKKRFELLTKIFRVFSISTS